MSKDVRDRRDTLHTPVAAPWFRAAPPRRPQPPASQGLDELRQIEADAEERLRQIQSDAAKMLEDSDSDSVPCEGK